METPESNAATLAPPLVRRATVGRIVHYVLATIDRVRPAIVIDVEGDGTATLHVFTDGENDGGSPGGPAGITASGVAFDEDGALNSWHWPPGA